jgi:hypothetical protein
MRQLQAEGGEVEWINECVAFGPYDHLDVFHLANVETAIQAATLVLVHGRVSRQPGG